MFLYRLAKVWNANEYQLCTKLWVPCCEFLEFSVHFDFMGKILRKRCHVGIHGGWHSSIRPSCHLFLSFKYSLYYKVQLKIDIWFSIENIFSIIISHINEHFWMNLKRKWSCLWCRISRISCQAAEYIVWSCHKTRRLYSSCWEFERIHKNRRKRVIVSLKKSFVNANPISEY